jgi:hypothetical protein
MKYVFTNGTPEQQQLWEEGAHRLLNFPFDAIPVTVTVTFDDAGKIPGGHTDLALTTWTYDSTDASTVVRNDAPSFGAQGDTMKAEAAGMGIPYSAAKFYTESAVHELGHALFAALPQPRRLAIIKMFGGNSEDPAAIQPPNTPWQDHISEGIAETFKEAFLPARYRVFPNRTNHKISYSDFPAFRAQWRDGNPEIVSSGGIDVDALLDLQTRLGGFSPNWLSRVFVFNITTKIDHNLGFKMDVPREWFAAAEPDPGTSPDDTGGLFGFAFRAKDADTLEVFDFIRGAWVLTNMNLADKETENWDEGGFDFANTLDPPNVPVDQDNGDGGFNHWLLYGEEAVALRFPPFTIKTAFSVPAGRRVIIQAWVNIGAYGFLPSPPPDFDAQIQAALPHLQFTEPPSVAGTAVILPSSVIQPIGAPGGSLPSPRPIVGNVQ